ncbi:uncharacterized protein [Epargyreus clarus]|uniref:uncharacterized protein n=1 Tax=Epargyreus clarus TaxID=520877 RepID=UPI003C2E2721
MENSHFFELLRALKDNGTGEDDASTSSGSIDESLRRSADAMERKLHQAFSYLKSFEDEMERVKFFMLKKYNKLPECPVMEPPVPRTCEELQEDLVRLVPQVTSSEEEDDDDADEWQDIDDDEQDEENKYQPDAADLENVVYGFHSLFGSFSELDMSKHLRLNEDQYAQFARMLIRCLPTKEMKERYGKLAQSYEDYTRALFEDLDTRRILRPNGEEYEDDEEYEIELKRRKADRERKILNFIGSLKYLKEQFDDDLHMANMVQGQMQDAQLFYAELQEEKRKEG